MTIKCAIVDTSNETLLLEKIHNAITHYPGFEITHQITSNIELENVSELALDVIFFNLNENDFQTLKIIDIYDLFNTPFLVFIMQNNNNMINAYYEYAFDISFKPINNVHFKNTLNKIYTHVQLENLNETYKLIKTLTSELSGKSNDSTRYFKDKFPVKTGKKTQFIDKSEIRYIIASGNYSELHLGEKKITLRDSLQDIQYKICDDKFIRIHRSTIINTDYIAEVFRSNYNDINVVMFGGKTLRVGKKHQKEVIKLLNL